MWAPNNILAAGVEKAVDFTADGGFIVNKLFDPTGQAAHSPTSVIHTQYIVTTEGPQKVAEWTSQLQ